MLTKMSKYLPSTSCFLMPGIKIEGKQSFPQSTGASLQYLHTVYISCCSPRTETLLHLWVLSQEAQFGILTQRVLFTVASVPQAPDQLQLGKIGSPEWAAAAGFFQNPLLYKIHGLLYAVMHFAFQRAVHKEEHRCWCL